MEVQPFCLAGECVVAEAEQVTTCGQTFLDDVFVGRDFLPKCVKSVVCAPGNERADARSGCLPMFVDQACEEHHGKEYMSFLDGLPEAKCLDKVCAPAEYIEGDMAQGTWVSNSSIIADSNWLGCVGQRKAEGCTCGAEGDVTNRCDGISRCVHVDFDPMTAKYGVQCQATEETPCPEDLTCNTFVGCELPTFADDDVYGKANWGMMGYPVNCRYEKGGLFTEQEALSGAVPQGKDACALEIPDTPAGMCQVAICGEEVNATIEHTLHQWGIMPNECGCYIFSLEDVERGTQCADVPWLVQHAPQLAESGNVCDMCIEQMDGTFDCGTPEEAPMGFRWPEPRPSGTASYIVSPFECQTTKCTVNRGMGGWMVNAQDDNYCAAQFPGTCATCSCDIAEFYSNAQGNGYVDPTANEVLNETRWLDFTSLGCDCSGSNNALCTFNNQQRCNGQKRCAIANNGMFIGLIAANGLSDPRIHSQTGCVATQDPINCIQSNEADTGTIPDTFPAFPTHDGGAGHFDARDNRAQKLWILQDGDEGRCSCEGKTGDALDICQNEHTGQGTFLGDTWVGQGNSHPLHKGFKNCMTTATEQTYKGRTLFFNEDQGCDEEDLSCNHALLHSCYRNPIEGSEECDLCDTRICVTVGEAVTEFGKFPAPSDTAKIFVASQVPGGFTQNPDLTGVDFEEYTCVSLDLGSTTCPPNDFWRPQREALTQGLRSSFRGLGDSSDSFLDNLNRAGFRQRRDVGCVSRECNSNDNTELFKENLPRVANDECCDTGISCVKSFCFFDEDDETDSGTCNHAYVDSVCGDDSDPCDPMKTCLPFTIDPNPDAVDPIINPQADENGCVASLPLCLGFNDGSSSGVSPPLAGSESYVPGFLSADKFCKVVTCNSSNPTDAWNQLGVGPVVEDGLLAFDFATADRPTQQSYLCRIEDLYECDNGLDDTESNSCAYGCCDADTGICSQTPINRLCDSGECGCQLPAFYWKECGSLPCDESPTSVFAAGANAFYCADASPEGGNGAPWEMNDCVSDIARPLIEAQQDTPVVAFFRDDFGDSYLLIAKDSINGIDDNGTFSTVAHVHMPSAALDELNIVCGGDGVSCSGDITDEAGLIITFADRCDGCGAYLGPIPLDGLANPNPNDAITFKISFDLRTLEENDDAVDRPTCGRRDVEDSGAAIDVWNIYSALSTDENTNNPSDPWQFRLCEVIEFDARCVDYACLDDQGILPRLQFKAEDFQLTPQPTVRAAFKTRSAYKGGAKVAGAPAAAIRASEQNIRLARHKSVFETSAEPNRPSNTSLIVAGIVGPVVLLVLIIAFGAVCWGELRSLPKRKTAE